MWTLINAFAGGAWSLLRAIPLGAYAWLLVLALAVWAQVAALSHARAAGAAAVRAELQPQLSEARKQLAAAHQFAADAQGQALALDAGLQQCIGTRTQFALVTSAVINQREQQRVAAVAALTTTREELHRAYASAADGCAGQPVPVAVVGVLDAAAFGPGNSYTYAVGQCSGAATGAGAGRADSAHACPATAGAYTAYADLSTWIAEGWAPALAACNADKSAIAALRVEP